MSHGNPSIAEVQRVKALLLENFPDLNQHWKDQPEFTTKATFEEVRDALEGSNWFISVRYPGKEGIGRYMLERVRGTLVKDSPRWLYHSTDPKHVPSILRTGLQPRTGREWGYPERVYLAGAIESAVLFADKKKTLAVLLVDTKVARVPLYHDEQFEIPRKGVNSVYTPVAIPAKAILGSIGTVHPDDLEAEG